MPSLESFDSSYPNAVNHIGVGVDDLDRAINWYRSVLGFVLLKEAFEVQASAPYDGAMALDVLGKELSSYAPSSSGRDQWGRNRTVPAK
jgi:catechol 2,3-dioxygenase-like lactoylglutathione lyase family enzyme